MESYPTETAAEAALVELLSPYFQLIPQVWLEHYTGKRLRIDYVGVPRVEFPASLIGIEVKAGFPAFRDYARALKQARDYRHARIIDRRATRSGGLVLPFVFVFPGLAAPRRSGWIEGADRLAGLDNVGAITVEYWQGVCLRISTDRLWSSESGCRADSTSWGVRRAVGSR